MPRNTNYLVFWSPRGISAYGPGSPPQFVSGLEQYFIDLAHDSGGNENVDSVATQYNDATGAICALQLDVRRRHPRHRSLPAEPVPGERAGQGIV